MEFMMKTVIVPALPFFKLVEDLKNDILHEAVIERERMFIFERNNLLDLTLMFFNMVLDASLLVNGKASNLEDMWAEKFHILDTPQCDEMTVIIDEAVSRATQLLDEMSVDTSSYTEIARGIFPYQYKNVDSYHLRRARPTSRNMPEALVIRPLGHFTKFITETPNEDLSVKLTDADILSAGRKKRNGEFMLDGFRRVQIDFNDNNSNPLVESLIERTKQERRVVLAKSEDLERYLSRDRKVFKHEPITIK